MRVLSIIFGILLIIGGIACLFNPAATLLQVGFIMAILLFIYGIVGIVNVIAKVRPAITLIASILALIIGIVAIIRPGTTLVFDAIMVYLFAAWFVIQGAMSIYMAISVRMVKKGWYWGLIIGIIAVILGIYCFFHPAVSVVAIGILVGIFLIEVGITLLTFTSFIDQFGDPDNLDQGN